jgi:hypothetical protein
MNTGYLPHPRLDRPPHNTARDYEIIVEVGAERLHLTVTEAPREVTIRGREAVVFPTTTVSDLMSYLAEELPREVFARYAIRELTGSSGELRLLELSDYLRPGYRYAFV